MFDPIGQDLLDAGLPQLQPVIVPRREIADAEPRPGEAGELEDLAFAQEAVGDAALVEHLDCAGVQAAGAGLGDRLVGAPLDDGDIDSRQRELGRQHQAGRAGAGDDDRMTGGCAVRAGSAARPRCRKQDRHVVTPRLGVRGRGLTRSSGA